MSHPEPICKIEMWSFVCNDESHQHYLWIWKTPFVSIQTSTPMRVVRPVCVGKYSFFPELSLTWSGSQILLLYSLAIYGVFLPFHENSVARMCRMIKMGWDLLLYSSASRSVFGSPCPARSSSLAHPLLPGHVLGRRDDDVVRSLENSGQSCWCSCFAKPNMILNQISNLCKTRIRSSLTISFWPPRSYFVLISCLTLLYDMMCQNLCTRKSVSV